MPRLLAAAFVGSLTIGWAQFPEITGSGEMKKEGGSGNRGPGARQAAPGVPINAPASSTLMDQPPVIETATPGAPRTLDQALRARANKFYQSHVDGKFRQADLYVAEDSKDAFFAMDKPRYLKVWGHKVQYAPDFRKAQVLTTVDFEMKAARIGSMVVRPQIPSYWKLAKGQWFWYKMDDKEVPTPWGNSKQSGGAAGGLQAKRVTVTDVLSAVSLSKSTVTLLSYKDSADTLKVTNGLPGEVQISVQEIVAPDLTVTVDKPRLKAGESAVIEFRYKPENQSAKPTLSGYVKVEPIGRPLPFQVIFDIPEDVKQKLPKLQ